MPILLWPFPSGVVPPPPTPVVIKFIRNPTGKIFILDDVDQLFFGSNPNLFESCAMIIYTGAGIPLAGGTPLFTFTKPDGTITTGDLDFGYVGSPAIARYYIPNFPAGQFVVYTFGINELDQLGTWDVQFFVGNYQSKVNTFRVVSP